MKATRMAWASILIGLFFSSAVYAESAEPIQAIPLTVELDVQKVRLGRELFSEARLSRDSSISCASCHHLNRGGADQSSVSVGVGGAQGDINSPTVFNAAFNFRQFWDGRAKDLTEQINGPVGHPKEMGTSWDEIRKKLQQLPEYRKKFSDIYSTDITTAQIKDVIVTFEKSLYTPNSKFDRFLRGDSTALSLEEKRGYSKFKEFGCIACHQGMNVGGNMYQTMGVMGDYFKDRGQIVPRDWGRYNITKKESDKFVFRVPSLRNVALTAPYFHDGSVQSLPEAVKIMAKYQLGRNLSKEDQDLLVKFLNTLSGEAPASLQDLRVSGGSP